jgi:hypothetical protein
LQNFSNEYEAAKALCLSVKNMSVMLADPLKVFDKTAINPKRYLIHQ